MSDHMSASIHKRPVSVGVCPLSGLMVGGQKISSEHEVTETIKMFSCDEKDHHQLHSMIIKGSNKINPASIGPISLNVKMRLLTGMLHEVRDQNQNIFPVSCNLITNNYPALIRLYVEFVGDSKARLRPGCDAGRSEK